MKDCNRIKDFMPISKLEKLEILDVSNISISDISFIEKNKNIKDLKIYICYNININDNLFSRKDIKIYL